MFLCGGDRKASKRKSSSSSGRRQPASCLSSASADTSLDQTIAFAIQDLASPKRFRPSDSLPTTPRRCLTPIPESKAVTDFSYAEEEEEDDDKENLFRTKTWSKTSVTAAARRVAAEDSAYASPLTTRGRRRQQTPEKTRLLPKASCHVSADSGLDSLTQTRQQADSRTAQLPKTELVITKDSSGFGFTIKGTVPVRVGRVKTGGAAERQGLRQGDFILTINGRDTTDDSVDTIANIVRHSTKQISLVIARKPSRSKKPQETVEPSPVTSVETPVSTDASAITVTDDSLPTPKAPSPTTAEDNLVKWSTDLSKQVLGNINTNTNSWQPELSVIGEEKSMATTFKETPKTTKWQPDLSHIESTDNTSRFLDSCILYSQSVELTMSERSRTYSWATSSSGDSTCQPDSFTTGSLTSTSSLTSSRSAYSLPDQADHYQNGREIAVHQLLTAEQDFCRLMKSGIQRFSRPLRHHLMSRAQHQRLFQNIEKLVALSESNIRSLTNQTFCAEDSYTCGPDSTRVHAVGGVYAARVQLASEAYHMYCSGLGDAMTLLDTLTRDKRFSKFLKRLERLRGFELSLLEFLKHPATHFRQLAGGLSRVLSMTSADHDDIANVQLVCRVMQGSVSKLSSVFTTIHASRTQSSSFKLPATSGISRSRVDMSAASVTSSVMSVDTELLELQSRVDFQENIKPFHLADPCRHIIFAGELYPSLVGHNPSNGSPPPLWAVLCSDLLLLTQKQGKGQLTVIEEPVFLSQMEADFDCKHPLEFRLMTQKSLPSSSSSNSSSSGHQRTLLSTCGVTEYRLRAASQEQKWAWKTLLEHRMKSAMATSKSHADSAFCSMGDF